jgi:hypothetical protein
MAVAVRILRRTTRRPTFGIDVGGTFTDLLAYDQVIVEEEGGTTVEPPGWIRTANASDVHR